MERRLPCFLRADVRPGSPRMRHALRPNAGQWALHRKRRCGNRWRAKGRHEGRMPCEPGPNAGGGQWTAEWIVRLVRINGN